MVGEVAVELAVHAEAERVLADANARARVIIEEARTQALFESNRIRTQAGTQARATMLRVPATTTPIHSSEISLREFPRATRGFDPEAVSKWLALVEQSYTLVEDELERRRHALEGLVAGLGDMRRHLADAGGRHAQESWDEILEIAASTLPSTRLAFDTLLVRTALLESPLRRAFTGYSRDQVRRLLETAASQLARLENQLHLAHAENDRLLSLFLEEIAKPCERDG